jgi:hypothetical protein
MDWCSVYLTPQGLPKYIYLSPPLIFPTTTELGQKTARCESLRALLPYVEWDRFVTLAGSKSGLKGGTSVMRRNLQMDVLKEYKMVWCHNYVKYNNIQNKFSLLKLCSVVRIHFYVIRYCICIYIRYDNVTLSPLLLPARVTNRPPFFYERIHYSSSRSF